MVILAGADPGKKNDYFAYCDITVEDRIATLLSCKIWLHKNYEEVVPLITQRFFQKNVEYLAVDSTGQGQVIVDMFNTRGVATQDINYGRKVRTLWINPQSPDVEKLAPIKFEMVQWYRWCSQNRHVKFPADGENPLADQLLQQLKQQELIEGSDPEHHENAKVAYGHPSGTHDDLCWAYLMALYIARPWIEAGGVSYEQVHTPQYIPR